MFSTPARPSRLRRQLNRAKRDGEVVIDVRDHVDGRQYVTLRPGEAYGYWTTSAPRERYRVVPDDAGTVTLVPDAET